MKLLNHKLEMIRYEKSSFDGKRSSIFILTRFNLKMWTKNKFNHDVQTEEWLKERFELFEHYCFSSIINQSEKNFIWLCCFDEDTPKEYLQKIQIYRDKCPQFVPLFFSANEAVNHVDLLLCVLKELKDDSSYLVTIRLDNDDSLRYDFIEKVSLLRKSQKEDNVIYSFCSGLKYYREYGIAINILYPENHFLVLINTTYNKETDKTILSFPHDNKDNFPYNFIVLKDYHEMWTEVIHSSNVANDIKKNLCNGLILNNKILKDKFNMEIGKEVLSKGLVQIYLTFIFKLIPHYIFWYGHKIKNILK